MIYEKIPFEQLLFFIFYGVTGVTPLIAALYLLFRQGNAIAAGVTSPVSSFNFVTFTRVRLSKFTKKSQNRKKMQQGSVKLWFFGRKCIFLACNLKSIDFENVKNRIFETNNQPNNYQIIKTKKLEEIELSRRIFRLSESRAMLV